MPASSQWNMTTRSFGPHPNRSAYDFSAARADCGSMIVSAITVKPKEKTIFISEAHFAEPWHGNGNESCGKGGKKRFPRRSTGLTTGRFCFGGALRCEPAGLGDAF